MTNVSNFSAEMYCRVVHSHLQISRELRQVSWGQCGIDIFETWNM